MERINYKPKICVECEERFLPDLPSRKYCLKCLESNVFEKILKEKRRRYQRDYRERKGLVHETKYTMDFSNLDSIENRPYFIPIDFTKIVKNDVFTPFKLGGVEESFVEAMVKMIPRERKMRHILNNDFSIRMVEIFIEE